MRNIKKKVWLGVGFCCLLLLIRGFTADISVNGDKHYTIEQNVRLELSRLDLERYVDTYRTGKDPSRTYGLVKLNSDGTDPMRSALEKLPKEFTKSYIGRGWFHSGSDFSFRQLRKPSLQLTRYPNEETVLFGFDNSPKYVVYECDFDRRRPSWRPQDFFIHLGEILGHTVLGTHTNQYSINQDILQRKKS